MATTIDMDCRMAAFMKARGRRWTWISCMYWYDYDPIYQKNSSVFILHDHLIKRLSAVKYSNKFVPSIREISLTVQNMHGFLYDQSNESNMHSCKHIMQYFSINFCFCSQLSFIQISYCLPQQKCSFWLKPK